MKRIGTIICMVCFCCATAFGQDLNTIRKNAAEIMSKYGGNDDVLDLSEVSQYVNDKSFKGIDADEDEQLLFEEYVNAYLYIRSNVDGTWSVDKNPMEKAIGYFSAEKPIRNNDYEKPPPFDAPALYRSNAAWKATIDYKAQVMLDAAGDNDSSINEDELVKYFERINKKLKGPASPESRFERLLDLNEKNKIDAGVLVQREHFKILFVREQFKSLDVDHNEALDLYEWSATTYSKVLEDFINVAGTDFVVDLEEYKSMAKNKPNTDQALLLDGKVEEEWRDYGDAGNGVPQEVLRKGFGVVHENEVAKAEKKQKQTVLGFPPGFQTKAWCSTAIQYTTRSMRLSVSIAASRPSSYA